MTAAEAEEEARCSLYRCLCRWRPVCSSRIPVAIPGRDYMCMRAGGDERPGWSMIVGVLSRIDNDDVLRLHRFRVARSGRILGRSVDVLEMLHDLRPRMMMSASATLTPDARSLCIFHEDYQGPPQALQLDKTTTTATVLPPLPLEPRVPCCPISAAGRIWAPSAHLSLASCTFRVAMQRLVVNGKEWEQVGDPFLAPYEGDVPPGSWGGRFLQGYAVLHRDHRTIILLSLKQAELFFTFDCSTCSWTQVTIDSKRDCQYIPIQGRGVYMQEDDTIYTLCRNTIFSYKLLVGNGGDADECSPSFKLEPPIRIDVVCPFRVAEGYGFLTRLGGRLMCAVWISVRLQCSCRNLHSHITTFQVRSPPQPIGIEVLHSTCRRLDVSPSSFHEFCFLQEYKDQLSHWDPDPVLLEDDLTSYQVLDASQMLECCRTRLSADHPFPSHPVLVEPATHINKVVYIICQAGSELIICTTSVMNLNGRLDRDQDKPLKQRYSIIHADDCHMLEQPLLWHFVCSSSCIYAISNIKDGIYAFGLDKECSTFDPSARGPTADPFIMVIRVGRNTIALTDTLQVFCHTTQFQYDTQSMWEYCWTDQSHVRKRKVNLSGYAVLDDDSFIVSDTDSSSCLFFDLSVRRWRVVMPAASFKFSGLYLPSTVPGMHLLEGRSVLVEGFIYTCANSGLAAYELLQEGDSMYLSNRIFLPFSWDTSGVSEKMCLDYAGKNIISGVIIFCVVQGEHSPLGSRRHGVRIATVQVKTVRTHSEKMKPVGIDHVDCLTRFIEHEKGVISTRSCFAVGS